VAAVLGDEHAVEVSLGDDCEEFLAELQRRTDVEGHDVPGELGGMLSQDAGLPHISAERWEELVAYCTEVPGYVESTLKASPRPKEPNTMAIYAWILILATAALLLIVTVMGTRRWRAAGLDIDGQYPPQDE
jgi:hypothetical protein